MVFRPVSASGFGSVMNATLGPNATYPGQGMDGKRSFRSIVNVGFY